MTVTMVMIPRYDCGIFTTLFCMHMSIRRDFDFCQEDMTALREWFLQVRERERERDQKLDAILETLNNLHLKSQTP
jgi:hypothetical protein